MNCPCCRAPEPEGGPACDCEIGIAYESGDKAVGIYPSEAMVCDTHKCMVKALWTS